MKRSLGTPAGLIATLAAVAALSACGGESDDNASDPAGGRPSSTSPSSPDSAPGDAEVVAIVSGSAAGGHVERTITRLDSDRALARYAKQFRSPVFADDLRAAVAEHPPADGRVLGAIVVDVSCDAAPSATVTLQDGQYVVTPAKVASPHPECYAAVTSVAVVDLPA